MSDKVPVITQPDESLIDSIKRAWNSVMSLAPKKAKDVPLPSPANLAQKKLATRDKDVDEKVKEQGG
jgi:hypothetical protein